MVLIEIVHNTVLALFDRGGGMALCVAFNVVVKEDFMLIIYELLACSNAVSLLLYLQVFNYINV